MQGVDKMVIGSTGLVGWAVCQLVDGRQVFSKAYFSQSDALAKAQELPGGFIRSLVVKGAVVWPMKEVEK